MKKPPYIIIPLLGLLFLANHAQAGIIIRPVINTGLVGYWSFNEGIGTKVGDMSGNGQNCTWNGSSTSRWIDGKFGKSGSFTSSNSDYLNCGTNDIYNFTSDFTISGWFKISSMPINTIYTLLGRNLGGYYLDIAESGYVIVVRRLASGDPYIQFNVSGATAAADPTGIFTGEIYNLWHQFVLIKEGNRHMLYLDGVFQEDDPMVIGDMSAPGQTFYIGKDGGNGYTNGQIDEIRAYNRALSASEITKLYESGLSKIGINRLGLVPDDLPANATVSYVREDCTGYSPCYNSLYDWEINFGGFGWDGCTPGDLTCLNKTAVAKIDGIWNSPDTTYVAVDGWVTDATRYIKIYTTAAARHPGKWDETKYRIEVSGSNILQIFEDYVTVDGLQVKSTASLGYIRSIYVAALTAGANKTEISNNIMWGVATGSAYLYGINPDSANNNSYIWNNIIYGFNDFGIIINGTGYVYNNTVRDNNYGFFSNGAVVIAKNNIAYNNTDNYSGTFDEVNSTNNLSGPSSDANTPSTNARNGVRVNFIDEANDDFHLSPADSGARNYGADLSNDTSISYPFDIDRQSRTSQWDIGADEATGAVINASQNNQLTDGLVGFWSFNGTDIDGNTAIDRSVNGNNGTITGATRIIGKVGQALSFDGSDDYVYAADSFSLRDLPNSAFTLSAWVKVNNDGDSTLIFDKCQGTSTNGWELFLDQWRRVQFYAQRQTTDLGVVSSLNTAPVYSNGWFHLAITYPGDFNVSDTNIYINGSEVSGYSLQQVGEGIYMSDSGLEARIGRNAWNSYVTANIDEVRIYNRALSAEEIRRLYNLGR